MDDRMRALWVAIVFIGEICGAYAQVPPQVAKPTPPTAFSILSIPPGTVVYKTLAEMPESMRAPILSAEAEGFTTQKTSDGVSFRTFNVEEPATTIVERERDRLTRLSKPGGALKLPDYLSRSSFKTLKFDVMGIEKSSSSGATLNATYAFSSPDGLYLLREWDYVADGGSVMRILDFCNIKVNDIPATYTVLRGPSGAESPALKWVTNSKSFELYYKGPLTNDQVIAQLLKLAQSLGN